MNNKGFTLVELIIWLLGIVVLFMLAMYMTSGALATAVGYQTDDEKIFLAAKNYVTDENIIFNEDNYICVTKRQLEKKRYLKGHTNTDKIIKLTKNKTTKEIDKIEYVSECK